ncbi:MAG: hypothetical protein QNJ38_00030 [Prochloraceae cyanobacterium]|nr:hypothetical protein [Prochloraceae cyanobacterium]
MKRANQLTQLIWDFWREDRDELKKLIPLANCKVSRWWGVIHIHCCDRETVRSIMEAEELIEQPTIELRLANKVKIWFDNNLVAVFSVKSSKKMVVQE